MDRRDFIKKATMAAAGAAVVSPVSAMLDNVTSKKCKVLLVNMPVVTSQYWNIAYGAGKGEVKLDTEGMQTMRTLATNMAFLLQKIHAEGNPAPQLDERPAFMNFIR